MLANETQVWDKGRAAMCGSDLNWADHPVMSAWQASGVQPVDCPDLSHVFSRLKLGQKLIVPVTLSTLATLLTLASHAQVADAIGRAGTGQQGFFTGEAVELSAVGGIWA